MSIPNRPLDSQWLREAINAITSDICPACGDEKPRLKVPFCDRCLEILPQELLEKVSDEDTFIANFHRGLEFIQQSGSVDKRPAEDE